MKVIIILESETQSTQDIYDLATAIVEGAEIPEDVKVDIIPSNET